MYTAFARLAFLCAIVPGSFILASPTPAALGDPVPVTFVNFKDEASKDLVRKAVPIATSVIEGAWCYLQKLGQTPTLSKSQNDIYTTVFGTYTPANYLTVYKHFRAKATDFELSGQGPKKNKLTYEVARQQDAEIKDKNGKSIERTSWVRGVGYTVYLGPKFMKANLASRVRALVHEPMHFRYTADSGSSTSTPGANHDSDGETYDSSAIKRLAKTNPASAINNADSLTMFAVMVHGEGGCSSHPDISTIKSLKKIFS